MSAFDVDFVQPKSFDTALPQDWVDFVTAEQVTYTEPLNPYGHIVWCYDDSISGYPLPIDPIGARILARVYKTVRVSLVR